MRALLVARKSLLEMLREWQLLLLVILLPLVFVGIAAVSYSNSLLTTHPILVTSPDPQVAPLIEELKAQRYADGRPVFDVSQTTDLDAAEAALKEQIATALVTVSADGRVITIRGDALYVRFYRASIILESIVTRFADRVAGRPEIVRIVGQPLGETSPQTEFDIYAPGMMVFALLLIIPQTAMLVAREIRWDTLRRLRLARLRAWDLLGGISIAQMVVAVVQVVIIFLTALALGFQVAEGSHVVQAIGQLNEDDTHIVAHGLDDFAQ